MKSRAKRGITVTPLKTAKQKPRIETLLGEILARDDSASFEDWEMKFRSAYQKYTTPLKLRIKDRPMLSLADVRALQDWETKYGSAYQKYTTPLKLRRKDPRLVSLVRGVLLELVEDYPHLLMFTFWDNLKQRGILYTPSLLPLLWAELERNPSEVLRIIADHLDARKASKGDRGARLLATKKLYDYAHEVISNGAKKLNWKQLKRKFCTYYETNENWQKFLRERGIPFKRVGAFRGTEHVRRRGKNTH